jgi:hypothetical protein
MADESVVVYKGDATTRRVTDKAWKSVGVQGQKTVVWDAKNNFSVPTSDLTPEALAFLKVDKFFTVPKDAEVADVNAPAGDDSDISGGTVEEPPSPTPRARKS